MRVAETEWSELGAMYPPDILSFIVFSGNKMTEKSKDKKQVKPKSTAKASAKKKKQFDVSFYHDWCKACGICMAFCPQKIIKADKSGKPQIFDVDKCVGCRFCEIHCPDFAITVSDRKPMRRQNDV
jgi:2-oxoglutarate ferredoxin oxidoreductase subunit delta